MVINPFIMGVFVTLFSELVVLVVAAWIYGRRK